MTAILTPALALRHLRELSTDVRAAVVLDAGGGLLAGDGAIEAPARELLGVLDELAGAARGELIVRVEDGATPRGSAVVARGGSPDARGGPPADDASARAFALVLAVGPHALLDLLRHDLATLLGDLAGRTEAGVEDALPALEPLPSPPAQVTAIDPSGRVRAPETADLAVRTAIFAASELLAAGEPRSAPR